MSETMAPITALVISTDGRGKIVTLVFEPEAIQELIHVGSIEYFGTREWTGYCDDEGKMNGSTFNMAATHLAWDLGWSERSDTLYGDVVFVGPPDNPGADTDVPQRVLAQASQRGLIRPVRATLPPEGHPDDA